MDKTLNLFEQLGFRFVVANSRRQYNHSMREQVILRTVWDKPTSVDHDRAVFVNIPRPERHQASALPSLFQNCLEESAVFGTQGHDGVYTLLLLCRLVLHTLTLSAGRHIEQTASRAIWDAGLPVSSDPLGGSNQQSYPQRPVD